MKKNILLAIITFCSIFSVQARTQYLGDVNFDGVIDVSDLTELINRILNGTKLDVTTDINQDGATDVSDATMLNYMILNGESAERKTSYDYVWDYDALPEIHIEVSVDEWNRLLGLYDANSQTKQYVTAAATFIKNGDRTAIDSVGLRLRGNTSRRRPEGSKGNMHSTDNTDWHHCHFALNFRKYVKDDDHTVQGIRKVNLKWFKDDACYVREMYCYDLFRRYGVWTGLDDTYCKLYLHVAGDAKEAYYGIYEMIEPADDNFLKRHKTAFGSNKGNLWKCEQGAASLVNTNGDFWYDDNSDDDHTYTLQTNVEQFDSAKAQLQDFMLKLKGKGDASFYTWINQVCDVDLLLKTYAVNVAVGMWDDYWNNANNFYIYFNSTDKFNYKFYFIPYDYDNTLGTSLNCGNQSDAGRQDPLKWGSDKNPLIKRILAFDDFKAKYIGYLKELCTEGAGLFQWNDSHERIVAWQNKIKDLIKNDTGEDMEIKDVPASWGNHSEYRIMEDGTNNFFRVKASVISGL